MRTPSSAHLIGRRALATTLSLTLLLPVAAGAVTAAVDPVPVPPGKKLHVCVTKDKVLRLAPFNKESFCRPGQQSVRLVVRDGGTTAGQPGAPGKDGAAGKDGAPGKDGVDGKDGKDGKDGVSGWERVTGAFSGDIEGLRTVTADCPAGKSVVGGGYESDSISDAREVVVLSSFPVDDDTWSVTASTDAATGDRSFAIRAYALCVLAS